MKFRTEIERQRVEGKISHDDRVLLLGSCFSDNVGARLARDGFDVSINPLGPLYNPCSLAYLITRMLDGRRYNVDEFYKADSVYHCLDFAMRYQSSDAGALAELLNDEIGRLKAFFDRATVVCLTFGSAEAFVLRATDTIVGNCHKLHDSLFERRAMSVERIVALWRPLLTRMRESGKRVIATVSPIRHLAYGLHGNQLGKAKLLLALDEMSDLLTYFPAYEIMIDDLRDYRFYASDMKHPSETACDYIYEKFAETYFDKSTVERAEKSRSEALRAAHRTMLT